MWRRWSCFEALMILFGLQSFRELSAGDGDEDDKCEASTQIEGILTKAAEPINHLIFIVLH